MGKLKKILVANRGEIAIRVMRSAREMGIKTVAIYSEADRGAPHVRYADQAVLVGPAQSEDSYLKGDKIIEVAKNLKADAIHPGYGFLSENASFAKVVSKAGLIFIGPSPEAIDIMGSKLKARKAVSKYDIPLIPGTEKEIKSLSTAKKKAKEIGYPLLIKASAGGGGKGTRVVETPDQFEEQMNRAVSEAESSFGDGAVFIEKLVINPKHIEIQVLGDTHGNIIHLFERECSIQRRFQKVVEEAPSPVMTEEIREAMGAAAIKVAKACNYYGAGTVEFIADEDLNFYFLEMNTRLQVEHPTTEAITGVDLVKEQIRIAEGAKLSIRQEDLRIQGHAIELRVYAEDPENGFLPDTGRLAIYQPPKGPGIRVDDGYEQDMAIPIYYDPMIAKLICYGRDREDARKKMIRALEEYQISGVATTIDFGKMLMVHPIFIKGTFDTNFIKNHYRPEENSKASHAEEKIAALFAANYWHGLKASNSENLTAKQASSKWRSRLKE
ncbi:MAG: acetyl-CoA carboxylase biotin carboxylase subunit [Cyclobacteriaceae bacterium]